MLLARIALERLLLLLFLAARLAFLWQGMGCVSASAALLVVGPVETPPWLRSTMLSALAVSATFFFAGVLLFVVRHRWIARASGNPLYTPAWPAGLALSLIAIPALAAHASSELPALWLEIGTLLDGIGFWDELTRAGQFSGILVLPILFALFVPALLTAAALTSIALPLALLPLLGTRSRLLPTLLAMAAVCQATFWLTGGIAADAFGRLVEVAIAAMGAGGDAELLRVAVRLREAVLVLRSTASGLALPLLGVLAWVVFLRPSGEAAAWFGESAA